MITIKYMDELRDGLPFAIEANGKERIYMLPTDTLEILLKDRTTGCNIIWATDNYSSRGLGYAKDNPIRLTHVTGRNSDLIKPRIRKTQREQISRTRDMAETFTPSWICNKQNNLVDEAWFGRKDVFNVESGNTWSATTDKIVFSEKEGKTWQDYVNAQRMEMTCGEAPYLASLYDTTTGDMISLEQRVGLLDRKLRVVNENTETEEEWCEWATKAFKATYGYEFQGDNLLLARENLLLTFIDYYENRFDKSPEQSLVNEISTIISWNLWQMDGMKFVVPFSCSNEEHVQLDLFGDDDNSLFLCPGCNNGNIRAHNGKYCQIKDWSKNKEIKAVSLL